MRIGGPGLPSEAGPAECEECSFGNIGPRRAVLLLRLSISCNLAY